MKREVHGLHLKEMYLLYVFVCACVSRAFHRMAKKLWGTCIVNGLHTHKELDGYVEREKRNREKKCGTKAFPMQLHSL